MLLFLFRASYIKTKYFRLKTFASGVKANPQGKKFYSKIQKCQLAQEFFSLERFNVKISLQESVLDAEGYILSGHVQARSGLY